MSPTISAKRSGSRWAIALLGTLFAFVLLLIPATAASADTTDDGQEVTDFYFAGVITFDDKPVPDVVMTIKGNGFEGETKTDADGKWRLYVPEKDKYTLTVDEETLPNGVIVDAAQLPEGTQPIAGTTASFEVEFGLTGTKIMNLFLGEGERVTVSFWDQLFSRLIGGLNFGHRAEPLASVQPIEVPSPDRDPASFPTYSAPGGLRQGPGGGAESPLHPPSCRPEPPP